MSHTFKTVIKQFCRLLIGYRHGILCPGQSSHISTWWLEELRRKILTVFSWELATLWRAKKKSPTLVFIAGPSEKRRQCVPALSSLRGYRQTPSVSKETKARNPVGQEKDAAFPLPLHQNVIPPPSPLILHLNTRASLDKNLSKTGHAPHRKAMLHFCSIPQKWTGGD